MKLPEDFMKSMGITQVELLFAEPKTVTMRLEGLIHNETKEKVTSVTIEEGPLGTRIYLNYKTEKGEGSIGANIKDIMELTVIG